MTHLAHEYGVNDIVKVASAGTSSEEEGNAMYPPAVRELKKQGVKVLPHVAIKLAKRDYYEYDLILGMESRNVTSAIRIFGGDPQDKVHRLADYSDNPRDIDDPWWTGDFYRAYSDIYESCQALMQYLIPTLT